MRKLKNIPKHIAFIVDGNRRWAKAKGLPQFKGHEYVVDEVLDKLIAFADQKGIKYLTFWIFSTENWKRGGIFAKTLFNLLSQTIDTKAEIYHQKGYRVRVIGDLTKLPKRLAAKLLAWQEKSQYNPGINVTIAINYGGRDEIIRAIKTISNNQFPISNLTKENFKQFLDTKNLPDPDMIIRTGGEKRLSGFLLWQSEYAELYFTDTFMPDFGTKEFAKALKWYFQRDRRFGK